MIHDPVSLLRLKPRIQPFGTDPIIAFRIMRRDFFINFMQTSNDDSPPSQLLVPTALVSQPLSDSQTCRPRRLHQKRTWRSSGNGTSFFLDVNEPRISFLLPEHVALWNVAGTLLSRSGNDGQDNWDPVHKFPITLNYSSGWTRLFNVCAWGWMCVCVLKEMACTIQVGMAEEIFFSKRRMMWAWRPDVHYLSSTTVRFSRETEDFFCRQRKGEEDGLEVKKEWVRLF